MTRRSRTALAALGLSLVAGSAAGQQALTPLPAGTVAPDFALVGSTRLGVGDTVRLSDFHGKTIILAFFYRARTKG